MILINFNFLYRRFAVAESDCNLAIALNRNYAKAYARRGAARFALQKLEDAKKGRVNIFCHYL